MQINLYIYNDVSNPASEEQFCGHCGHKIGEVKGNLVTRVHGAGAPIEVFRADTAYVRLMCRSCKTRTNVIIHSYQPIPSTSVTFVI